MRYWLTILSCLLLAACDNSDDTMPTTPAADMQTVQLGLSFPVVEGEATRAPGDPGTTETLDAPTYAYIWFVDKNGDVQRPRYNDGATWVNLPRKVELASFFGAKATEEYTGSLATTGDQIYRYPIRELQMNSEWAPGKFYVVAANEALKQGGTALESLAGIDAEADVLALTFDLYDDDMTADLKNIYSTPYNYNVAGNYYGAWSGATNEMINLMLYHVAARVDIKWNVDPSLQATRKVKTMDVEQLKQNSCLIFKPMENTALGATPYAKSLKTTEEVGRQWYGRSSFYTIPYQDGDYFKLDLKVHNGAAENTTTVKLNMTGANPVFVPWIRVNLTYDEESDFTQSTLTLGE